MLRAACRACRTAIDRNIQFKWTFDRASDEPRIHLDPEDGLRAMIAISVQLEDHTVWDRGAGGSLHCDGV